MASDSQVFWGLFLHEPFGEPRTTIARTCISCNERVRTSDPAKLAGSNGFGHDVDCHSFDYADGLGIPGTPTAPGIPLRSDVFWFAALRADNGEDERATVKRCRTCEGVLFVDEPAAINYSGDRSEIGHDPDCRALSFATTLGIATGGDTGGSPVTLARADITLSRADITLATLTA